jgi:hypothetical protein
MFKPVLSGIGQSLGDAAAEGVSGLIGKGLKNVYGGIGRVK